MKKAVITGMAVVSTLFVVDATARGTPQAPLEAVASGKALYEVKCVICHGTDGRGDGPAAFLLSPRPRDFTKGTFKIRSTVTLPTDEDLFRTITSGIRGTAMPSFAFLSEGERWALVAYIKRFSERFVTEALQPIPIPEPPPPTQGLIALGKELYEKAGCLDCHGPLGKGDGPAAPTLKDEWGFPVNPSDFTIPGRMKGGPTVSDTFRTLTTGFGGTPMPSYADALSEEERWALAYYIRSLAKEAPRGPDLEELKGVFVISPCMNCHPNGREGIGPPLFGPDFEKKYPSDELIVKLVRSGRGEMPFIPPDLISDEDLAAVIAYLRSLNRQKP